MCLWCEIANGYYGNGEGNKAKCFWSEGTMEKAKWGPNLLLDIIHSLLFLSHSRLSHFLWSLLLALFFFSLLFPNVFLISVASFSLCLSLSHFLSIFICPVSWRCEKQLGPSGEKARAGGGKGVGEIRCERGRWEISGGKWRGTISKREDEEGEKKECERATEKGSKSYKRRLRKSGGWGKNWCERHFKKHDRKKYGFQQCKWCGTQLAAYLGYFLNPLIFFFSCSKLQILMLISARVMDTDMCM